MLPGWGLIVISLVVLGAWPQFRAWVDRATAEPPLVRPGVFVVARPGSIGPPFAKSVVFMVRFGPDRFQGLVVNRTELRSDGTKRFWGGPVAPKARTTLVRTDEAPRDAEHVTGQVYVVDGPMDWLPGTTALRESWGYSGWLPGQLEAEIARGAWLVIEADPDLAFTAEPELLWAEMIGGDLRAALRGGK